VARRRASTIRRTTHSAMAIAIDDSVIAESGWLRLSQSTSSGAMRLNAGQISARMRAQSAGPLSLGGWGIAQPPVAFAGNGEITRAEPLRTINHAEMLRLSSIAPAELTDHDRLTAAARFRAELSVLAPAQTERIRPRQTSLNGIGAAGLGILLLILMLLLWAPSVIVIKGSGLRPAPTEQTSK
jgi:hypothetical protein